MRASLANLWENTRSSLWFVPTILVAVAFALSSVLIEIDVLLAERQSTAIPWLFSGTADAARTMLSVVAGSLITVISIAISLTMVALVQASAQFTPRLLRQFTASRVNQIVLGAYTGTFIYALLILRTVRSSEQSDPFVPALSVTVAVGLALVCLGLLIFFIHHMSQSLQVTVIMDQVRNELIEQIDDLYPENMGEVPLEPQPISDIIRQLKGRDRLTLIRSEKAGFLRRIDETTLQNTPFGAASWLWIRPKIGDYVTQGGILGRIESIDNEQVVEHVRKAFVIDRERTPQQDPMFAIRQLVDIGLKALSPGINDPTTAEHVLYHLGDALGQLAIRPFPSNIRATEDQRTQIIFSRPAWSDFVDTVFSQIRRAAESDVHVTSTLLEVLYELALHLPPGSRADPIRQQVAEVRTSVEQSSFSLADKKKLYALANSVEDVVAGNINQSDTMLL